jgi:protein-disulfide isomerase/uncharacterized membrane protein
VTRAETCKPARVHGMMSAFMDARAASTNAPSPTSGSLEAARRPSAMRLALMLVLCIAGLAVAVELTVVHVRVHIDPAYRSFCAVSDAVNCETVAQSRYSVFLGVPVSVWGLLGYLIMGLVSLWGLRLSDRRGPAFLMALLTAGSAATSATLGTISLTVIASVCLLCLASYLINFALLVLGVWELRRWGPADSLRALLGEARRWGRSLPAAAAGAAVTVGLMAFYPAYWEHQRVAAAARTPLPTGVDEQGHAWIGAQTPKLTIVEYSDYECPHCRRSHDEVRALVSRSPEAIRLVHRHYPLDQSCNPAITSPFHRRACAFASLAICAGMQERFWQANDFLFQQASQGGTIDASTLAAALKLDAVALDRCVREQAPARLRADLDDGARLGIRGTPTFVVDGKVYSGRVPPEVVQPFLPRGHR